MISLYGGLCVAFFLFGNVAFWPTAVFPGHCIIDVFCVPGMSVLPDSCHSESPHPRSRDRTGGLELPPPTFFLQPLLMHISNLQVLSLFAQLRDLGHVRFQLSFVTTNDTDSYYRPLPFVLIGHFGNRGIETGT